MAPRLPRFKRQPDFARQFRATERDLSILREVATHRFLTSRHIQMLVPGSTQQILRRLQLLFHHGYLTRPLAQLRDVQQRNLALVYGLASKGAKILGMEIDWTVKNRETRSLFLKHTLLIADVLVALKHASRNVDGISLLPSPPGLFDGKAMSKQSLVWRVSFRHAGANHSIGLVPDAVFGLQSQGKPVSWFCLEADRGTMPVVRSTLRQTSIQKKLLAYAHTERQQLLLKQWKIPAFKVLFVSSSKSRLTGIRRIADGQRDRCLTIASADFLNPAKTGQILKSLAGLSTSSLGTAQQKQQNHHSEEL